MKHSTQKTVSVFLNNILKLASKGSSENYAAMVLTRYLAKIEKKYPFVKAITVTPKRVIVDKRINKASPHQVGKLLTNVIDSLFSDLFKLLVKRTMPMTFVRDLENLGVPL